MKSAAVPGILLFSFSNSSSRPAPSADRNPGGASAPAPGGRKGRHLLWGVLLVIAALVVIVARGWFLRQPALTGHSLVTITEVLPADEAKTGHPRSWIGLAGPGPGAVSVLSERFWSASSPAPSFDGRRFLFRGLESETGSPALWEMGIDGSGLNMVTRGLADPGDPLYLPDGRILFSDAPADGGGSMSPVRSLFSCLPDGSEIERLTFGDYRDGRPELLADGRIRFVRQDGSGTGDRSPMMMTINADGTGLARFIAPAEDGSGAPPAMPTAPGDNRRIAEVVNASARRPPAAGTGPPEGTGSSASTGTLLCINAYLSDLPGISRLREGEIRKVRVSRAGFSGMDGMGRPKPPEVLAEADVFADGSFLVEVPADTPLQLLLLGDHDRPLAAHEHGIWVRPGENRGCVGCHENRDQVPGDRLPLALQHGAHGDGGPGDSPGPQGG